MITTVAAQATTAVPSTTTTSTTLPLPPPCAPADVMVSATVDKATYATGEIVNVAVAAQNRSGHVCQPVDPSVEFRDAAGNSLGGGAIADIFTMPVPGQPPPHWNPGQTLSTTFGWRPTCPPMNGPCPPGTYSVTATFGPFRSAPTPFSIGP